MKITAAVALTVGAPLEAQTLELDALRPDEVRVRMVAAGVCHTDASVRDAVLPAPMPIVLGHEGAGVVEALGADVTGLEVGDHVVLSFASCGRCAACRSRHPAYCDTFGPLNFGGARADGTTSLRNDAGPVASHFFGQSSFASHANVSQRSVVKVPREVPLLMLAPLGCGIATGAGTVLNVLDPGPDDSIVVLGAGAVGTAAMLAAVAAGCATIIVSDVVPERLELALALGATHAIDARNADVVSEIRAITRGGARYAIDTTGSPAVFRQMVDSLAPRGTGVLVGASSPGTEASIDIGAFLVDSPTITSVIEGDAVPQEFIPRLVALYLEGRLPLERLVTTYEFADVERAFADAAAGRTLKPVFLFPDGGEASPAS